MDEAQAQQCGPGGQSVGRQQGAAGPAHETAVGERHGKGGEGLRVHRAVAQVGVEVAPPRRLAVEVGKQVDEVGERQAPGPEPVQDGVVRHESRDHLPDAQSRGVAQTHGTHRVAGCHRLTGDRAQHGRRRERGGEG